MPFYRVPLVSNFLLAAICSAWLLPAPPATASGSKSKQSKGSSSATKKATPSKSTAKAASTSKAKAKAVAPKSKSDPGEITTNIALPTHQFLLSNPRMYGHFKGSRPVLTGLTGDFSGGKLAMEGLVDLSKPTGPQFAQVRLTEVQIGPLLALVGAPAGDAKISGIINLRWSGANLESIARSLDGKVSLQLTSASLTSRDMLDALSDFSGTGLLERLDFESGNLEVLINNGRAQVLSHKLSGPVAEIQSEGEVDLATGKLDLRLDMNLKASLALSSTKLGLAALLMNIGPTIANGEPESKTDAKQEHESAPTHITVPSLRLVGTMQKPQLELQSGGLLPIAPDLELIPEAPIVEGPIGEQVA